MEDLQASLDEALAQASKQPKPAEQSTHQALYKIKASYSNQEQRRSTLLKEQKEKRKALVNKFRNLDPNLSDEEEEDESEGMEITVSRAFPRTYRNTLMLSEWLVEVPPDLETNWVSVLCPIGKRTLIVAAEGVTRSYSRTGFRIASFPSKLPGGNRSFHRKSSDCCMLDCIYCTSTNTYYVMDVLHWKAHPLKETQTDFRFFWVDTKLAETGAESIDKLNPYSFVALTRQTYPQFKESMLETPPYPVDGVLFFHKESMYVSGKSPLACWLKPFMVPEKLSVPVGLHYLTEKPSDYVDLLTYIEQTSKRKKKGEAMDTSTALEGGGDVNIDD